jgi:ABC-type transporter Mla maintaining outer membrane lipid asymmetry ATPase subunit MlaF
MTETVTGSGPVIEMRGVEKQYGGLRPLRVRHLELPVGRSTMLLGFDRPAAETFINLMTGSALPEAGDVVSFGRSTRAIADSADWLQFVEQFGIVSDRVVLLDAMTVAQNLAISFDLEIDPIPDHILARVATLAAEVGIDERMLTVRVGEADPYLKARVRLARALAFDPVLLVLEHPTATLLPEHAAPYGSSIKAIAAGRNLTVVGLTADRKFAEHTGGRLLVWQPATGEFREGPGRRFWQRS